MQILLITDDYIPSSKKVGAKMLHELACELIKRGHSVNCITPNTYSDESHTTIEEIRIYRFKTTPHKNTGKLRRLIAELSFSKKVLNLINQYPEIKPDAVIYYSPSIFFGKAILSIKEKFNIPSYLILRDFFPQWAIDQGMIKNHSFITQLLKHYEKTSYRAATQIGVMSPNNLKWLNTYTNNTYIEHLHILPNWARPDFLKAIPANTQFRIQHNLENKVIFIYGGNIGHAQDMRQIILLADKLRTNNKAFFLLIGQGDEYQLVQNLIKQFNLKNILLLPAMHQDKYFAIQQVCDIGLFGLHANHKTHNFPGKLLGYMAQGIPMLGYVNPGNDLAELVNNANAGYITPSNNLIALHKGALSLIDNSSELKKIGLNSQKLLKEKFLVQRAADTILNKLSCHFGKPDETLSK